MIIYLSIKDNDFKAREYLSHLELRELLSLSQTFTDFVLHDMCLPEMLSENFCMN